MGLFIGQKTTGLSEAEIKGLNTKLAPLPDPNRQVKMNFENANDGVAESPTEAEIKKFQEDMKAEAEAEKNKPEETFENYMKGLFK